MNDIWLENQTLVAYKYGLNMYSFLNLGKPLYLRPDNVNYIMVHFL